MTSVLVPTLTARWDEPDSFTLEAYRRSGGYQALPMALGMDPDEVIQAVKDSGLRGRGGAGFPTGVKWGFIPQGDGKPHYLVVNADESEPGTCKDIPLMLATPQALVEGAVIAAYAIRANRAFIYVRGEVLHVIRRVHHAVAEAYAAGYLGENILGSGFDLEVTVHAGAGAYECGEETALLDSLEGLRGQPRLKPPFPAIKGLFGDPTIVNNVETLMNVPAIIDKGGAWFNALGMGRSGGTRIVCVSGHIHKPGVYELPMGITFTQMINEICGGVWKGRTVKAVIPGGVSMPPLDASELDVPCEFDALQTDERIKPVMVRPGQPFDLGGGRQLRTMAGSGGVVVMDEQTDIPRATWRIMKFFAHESCGQCTPCREGTGWLEKVSRRVAEGNGKDSDLELLASIAHGIAGNTICALGDAAAWPMLGFLTKFRADFEAKITRRAA